MGEELLPGLVKVIEERMGRFGRPFTTLIIVSAGTGIIAWAVSTVLNDVLVPIAKVLGGDIDPGLIELLQAVVGAVFIALFVVLAIGGIVYLFRQFRDRSVNDKVRQLEAEVERLKSAAHNGNVDKG